MHMVLFVSREVSKHWAWSCFLYSHCHSLTSVKMQRTKVLSKCKYPHNFRHLCKYILYSRMFLKLSISISTLLNQSPDLITHPFHRWGNRVTQFSNSPNAVSKRPWPLILWSYHETMVILHSKKPWLFTIMREKWSYLRFFLCIQALKWPLHYYKLT